MASFKSLGGLGGFQSSSKFVYGGAEIAAALRELPNKVRTKILKRAVAKAAMVIRKEARRRAPVRTGEMKRNIIMKYEPSRDKNEARYVVLVRKVKRMYGHTPSNIRRGMAGKKYFAEGSAFYWRFLEFGTARIHATMFMRKSFGAKKDEAMQIIMRELREGLDS